MHRFKVYNINYKLTLNCIHHILEFWSLFVQFNANHQIKEIDSFKTLFSSYLKEISTNEYIQSSKCIRYLQTSTVTYVVIQELNKKYHKTTKIILTT